MWVGCFRWKLGCSACSGKVERFKKLWCSDSSDQMDKGLWSWDGMCLAWAVFSAFQQQVQTLVSSCPKSIDEDGELVEGWRGRGRRKVKSAWPGSCTAQHSFLCH